MRYHGENKRPKFIQHINLATKFRFPTKYVKILLPHTYPGISSIRPLLSSRALCRGSRYGARESERERGAIILKRTKATPAAVSARARSHGWYRFKVRKWHDARDIRRGGKHRRRARLWCRERARGTDSACVRARSQRMRRALSCIDPACLIL